MGTRLEDATVRSFVDFGLSGIRGAVERQTVVVTFIDLAQKIGFYCPVDSFEDA